MAMNSLQLTHDATDVFGAVRNINLSNFLHCICKSKRVRCRTNTANAFHQEKRLIERLALTELFDTPVIVTCLPLDISHNFALAIEFKQLRLFLQRVIWTNWYDFLFTHALYMVN